MVQIAGYSKARPFILNMVHPAPLFGQVLDQNAAVSMRSLTLSGYCPVTFVMAMTRIC